MIGNMKKFIIYFLILAFVVPFGFILIDKALGGNTVCLILGFIFSVLGAISYAIISTLSEIKTKKSIDKFENFSLNMFLSKEYNTEDIKVIRKGRVRIIEQQNIMYCSAINCDLVTLSGEFAEQIKPFILYRQELYAILLFDGLKSKLLTKEQNMKDIKGKENDWIN